MQPLFHSHSKSWLILSKLCLVIAELLGCFRNLLCGLRLQGIPSLTKHECEQVAGFLMCLIENLAHVLVELTVTCFSQKNIEVVCQVFLGGQHIVKTVTVVHLRPFDGRLPSLRVLDRDLV